MTDAGYFNVVQIQRPDLDPRATVFLVKVHAVIDRENTYFLGTVASLEDTESIVRYIQEYGTPAQKDLFARPKLESQKRRGKVVSQQQLFQVELENFPFDINENELSSTDMIANVLRFYQVAMNSVGYTNTPALDVALQNPDSVRGQGPRGTLQKVLKTIGSDVQANTIEPIQEPTFDRSVIIFGRPVPIRIGNPKFAFLESFNPGLFFQLVQPVSLRGVTLPVGFPIFLRGNTAIPFEGDPNVLYAENPTKIVLKTPTLSNLRLQAGVFEPPVGRVRTTTPPVSPEVQTRYNNGTRDIRTMLGELESELRDIEQLMDPIRQSRKGSDRETIQAGAEQNWTRLNDALNDFRVEQSQYAALSPATMTEQTIADKLNRLQGYHREAMGSARQVRDAYRALVGPPPSPTPSPQEAPAPSREPILDLGRFRDQLNLRTRSLLQENNELQGRLESYRTFLATLTDEYRGNPVYDQPATSYNNLLGDLRTLNDTWRALYDEIERLRGLGDEITEPQLRDWENALNLLEEKLNPIREPFALLEQRMQTLSELVRQPIPPAPEVLDLTPEQRARMLERLDLPAPAPAPEQPVPEQPAPAPEQPAPAPAPAPAPEQPAPTPAPQPEQPPVDVGSLQYKLDTARLLVSWYPSAEEPTIREETRNGKRVYVISGSRRTIVIDANPPYNMTMGEETPFVREPAPAPKPAPAPEPEPARDTDVYYRDLVWSKIQSDVQQKLGGTLKGYDRTLSEKVNKTLLEAVRSQGYGGLERKDESLLKLVYPDQTSKYTWKVDTSAIEKPYATINVKYDVQDGKNTLTSIGTTVGGAKNKASLTYILRPA